VYKTIWRFSPVNNNIVCRFLFKGRFKGNGCVECDMDTVSGLVLGSGWHLIPSQTNRTSGIPCRHWVVTTRTTRLAARPKTRWSAAKAATKSWTTHVAGSCWRPTVTSSRTNGRRWCLSLRTVSRGLSCL